MNGIRDTHSECGNRFRKTNVIYFLSFMDGRFESLYMYLIPKSENFHSQKISNGPWEPVSMEGYSYIKD